MQAGDLRTRIRIQYQKVTGTGSFAAKTWTDLVAHDVYAEWKTDSGSESVTGESEQSQDLATVTIRYRSDVKRTHRIVKDGINYDILAADDVDQRHQWLKIKARAAING